MRQGYVVQKGPNLTAILHLGIHPIVAPPFPDNFSGIIYEETRSGGH